MTEVLAIDPAAPDAAVLERAAECLRGGGLVAFPTETVYGLGAHALDPAAVARIFAAKGRPSSDPLIVHVARGNQLDALVRQVPRSARELASKFWPGPLTLVVPRSEVVPDAVTAGLPTVAVRVPSHPVAHALLEAADLPVAAPSANLFSRPSPTRASHVLDDLDGRVDIILDAGQTTVGVESTVLDLSTVPPVVLRPGAIPVELLREVLGEVVVRHPDVPASGEEGMPSPGLLSKHYSPRVPMTLYEGDPERAWQRLSEDARAAREAGARVGIIDFGDASAADVASRLFATLREMDASGVDAILVRGIEQNDGLGRAVRDRLRRAAAGRVVIA